MKSYWNAVDPNSSIAGDRIREPGKNVTLWGRKRLSLCFCMSSCCPPAGMVEDKGEFLLYTFPKKQIPDSISLSRPLAFKAMSQQISSGVSGINHPDCGSSYHSLRQSVRFRQDSNFTTFSINSLLLSHNPIQDIALQSGLVFLSSLLWIVA